MFNLSRKFLIKGNINQEIKKEFLNIFFEEFWDFLLTPIDGKLKAFSHNRSRYFAFPHNKGYFDKNYDQIRSLPIKKQKEYAQHFKDKGWEGLRTDKNRLVPDYTLILTNSVEELITYTNIQDHTLIENKKMIIRFLCFLNDKKLLQFPLVLEDYYYLNADHRLRDLKTDVPSEIYDEHMFIHKNENIRIYNIIRASNGDLDELTKEQYDEVILFIDNEIKEPQFSRPYHHFIDSIYYVASRKRKDLDSDFVISRYAKDGDWFSFHFLSDFDGMTYYQSDLEKFLVNYEYDPKTLRMALRILIKYLVSLKTKPKWNEINRLEHIFDPKRKNHTLLSFMKKEKVSDNLHNIAISALYKFFDYLRSKGKLSINPIFPKEDYKSDYNKRKKHGTHRKSINEEIILEAKKIISENNFEFARNGTINMRVPEAFNHKTKTMDKNVWCPSIAIALYTLLEIPIRGLQCQLLDSGEGDEFRYSFKEKRMVKNTHPLSERGRTEGFVRKSGYESFDGEFYSLWITTNKSISDGYEIPYLSEEFYKVMATQYEFLETYDPNPIKVNKGEIMVVSMMTKYPMFFPLFRDLSSRKKMVPNKKKIELFWGQVCLELEKRYEAKGIQLSLTQKKHHGIASKYDIHSLRVTGITNLLDKGVPLNLVSKYFAGHQSFAMTLWYNSPHPQKLREHLEKAKTNAVKNGEWNFSELEESVINSNFVGENKNLLANNSGLLSIGISGICPLKRCDIGGEEIKGQKQYKPVPMGANGPNCFQCRFFVTGPKFLVGQMIEGNLLIRNIQKKVQFIDELKEQIMDAEDNKDLNKLSVLKGQKRVEDESYKNMLHEWWSRMKTFEASKKMMENNQNSLVVYGEDVKPILKEMGSFELLHNITTFGEFFPEFVNFKEPFVEMENVLSKFLMKNDVKPFILSLEGKDKVKACNLMGDLLIGMSNQYDIDSLLDGKILLKDIPQLQGKIDKLLQYKGK